MITNEPYGAEPWSLTESSLNLDMLAQSESVFALSNGHIGLRGNLDEGEPNGLPGTYLNSVYEDALAGVAAGRAGNFGFVVGVDRVGQADQLHAHGADVVVKDLADLL